MEPQDIKIIVEHALKEYGLSLWWAYLVFVVSPFVGAFVATFAKKKAEIAATKKYTEELQKVSHQNQVILENQRAHNSLRMAAIDKRLQAHQEACGLWRKINANLNTEGIQDVVIECDNWWSNNSLYLEPEPREAFLTAWVSAKDLAWYKDAGETDLVSKCYRDIELAGQAITNAVELPTLNEAIKEKSA